MPATIEDDLPCQELVELITRYLEHQLPPDEQARFEAHLAACRHCARYLGQFRQTVELLGRLPTDSIPTRTQRRLLRAFRGWEQEQRPKT